VIVSNSRPVVVWLWTEGRGLSRALEDPKAPSSHLPRTCSSLVREGTTWCGRIWGVVISSSFGRATPREPPWSSSRRLMRNESVTSY
jgi:hypothetical protein